MINTMKVLIATFFIGLSLSNSAWAVTNQYENLFKRSITSKRVKYKKFGISLYKRGAVSGEWKPVYEHNQNRAFTPASITKVITAVGLLEKHGTNKTIETSVWSSEKPKGEILKGNLYIKGAGDPTLVSEKLWLLVNEIKKWGVEKIDGNLVFDDTAFDRNLLDGDRSSWNQRAYNSALSGLSLNWNSVRVRFLDGETLNVTIDPKNPYFDLRPKKLFKKASQVEIRDVKNKEIVSVFFGKDALKKEKSIYRRVVRPRKYFESQFVQFLKSAGISYTGKIVWRKTPEDLFKVGKIESASMSRMLNLMMKFSNNFIADMLTKFSFYDETGEPGTYNGGLSVLKNSVSKIHSFSSTLVYESASGLSRDNKVSPSDFNKFMIETRKKSYFPELLSSFPLSCIDGTLKKRICKKKGVIRAKTGLLAGVAALSGFYKKGRDEYAFTFIYNGKNGEQFDARNTFDHFLEQL